MGNAPTDSPPKRAGQQVGSSKKVEPKIVCNGLGGEKKSAASTANKVTRKTGVRSNITKTTPGTVPHSSGLRKRERGNPMTAGAEKRGRDMSRWDIPGAQGRLKQGSCTVCRGRGNAQENGGGGYGGGVLFYPRTCRKKPPKGEHR